MTEASYYQPKKGAPGALAMVLALHAAGIAGLMMWKIAVPPHDHGTFIAYPVPPVVEPDPNPPEPKADPPPQNVDKVYVPERIVPLPPIEIGPIVEPTDKITPPVWPPLGGDADGPANPPQPRIEQAARAKGDVRRLFTADDYPTAAIRRGETGSARAKLAIGADGKVTGCSIVESSGSSTLDQATCRILRARARFTPAKDSSGQLTSDSYVTPPISWQLVDQG